jgi:hypothetical protein
MQGRFPLPWSVDDPAISRCSSAGLNGAEHCRTSRSSRPWGGRTTSSGASAARGGWCAATAAGTNVARREKNTHSNGVLSALHARSGALSGHVHLARLDGTDCQKLSLQQLVGNARAQYHRRPHFREPSEHRVMCDECANRSDPKPPSAPRCLGCARPMKFVRRTRRFGGLHDLYTFHCRGCSEWHTEEARQ